MRYVLVLSIFFIAWACGQKEDVEYKKVPYEGNNVKKDFSLIEENCLSCHGNQAPTMVNEKQILAAKSKICAVLKAGSMPPSGPLPKDKADALMEATCS